MTRRKRQRAPASPVSDHRGSDGGEADTEDFATPTKINRSLTPVDKETDLATSEDEQSHTGSLNDALADSAESDGHDSECMLCGTDDDPERLVCCDACVRVAHITCLTPPLKHVPKGLWLCPICQPAGEIERILDVRVRWKADGEGWAPTPQRLASATKTGATSAAPAVPHKGPRAALSDGIPTAGTKTRSLNELVNHLSRDEQEAGRRAPSRTATQLQGVRPIVNGAGGSPPADRGGCNTQEYYVKLKGQAYLHCRWLPRDLIVSVGQKVHRGLLTRLKCFDSKHALGAEAGVLGTSEIVQADIKQGVHSNWLTVERVVSQRDTPGGREFLIKWGDLGYDECTWEAFEELAAFKAKFEQFERQKSLEEEYLALGHPQDFNPLEALRQHVAIAQREAMLATQEAGKAEGLAAAAAGGVSRRFSKTPDFLKAGELYPYQLEGLNWLFHAWVISSNVILADEMGLGKTIMAISLLAAMRAEGVLGPHLVVVPLSTLANWAREFAAWAPDMNVVTLIGNPEARKVIKDHELYVNPQHGTSFRDKRSSVQARVKFHVLLTSNEMVKKEAADLKRLQWECLIVDEGHRLKQNGELFTQLTGLSTQHRVLLTGTPLQNGVGELFQLLCFLEPVKFGSMERLEAEYADLAECNKVEKLHELLKPHLLRRMKADVLKQLPPKLEQIVRVELSPVQKDCYRAILTRNYPQLAGGIKERLSLTNVMMDLRKCCNHAHQLDSSLLPNLPHTNDHAEILKRLLDASGKLQLLDMMLVRLKARGHRVLICSQFVLMLDILNDYLFTRKWGFQRIDGRVPSAERQGRIDLFNTKPDSYFVFLLSTKAGGLGINLATADTVIIFDSDWNPQNDLQAQARAHRIGQEKPVMIYRLVTRGTIEERMLHVSKSKRALEKLVVRKANKVTSQKEIDDLLRYGTEELFAEAAADKAQCVADAANNGQDQSGTPQSGAPEAAAMDAAAPAVAGTPVAVSPPAAAQSLAEAVAPAAAAVAPAQPEAPGAAQTPAQASAATAAVAPAQPEAPAAAVGTGEEGVKRGRGRPSMDPAGRKGKPPLERTREREQKAGRTGGADGNRIVYDESAIERLLDRSKLTNAMSEEADGAGGDGHDLMSSFQVAHFTAVQQPEEVVVAAAAQQAPAAGPGGIFNSTESPEYWEKLLGQQHRELRDAELKALGKGKRERKQVSYRDDNHLDPKDKEYAPSSGGSGDEASEPEPEPIDLEEDPLLNGRKRRRRSHPLPAAIPNATGPHAKLPQCMSGRISPKSSGLSSLPSMISPSGKMTGYPPGIYAPSGVYQRSPNGSVVLQNVRDAVNAAPGESRPTWIHPAKQAMNVVSAQGDSSIQNLNPHRWGTPSTNPRRASPPKGSGQNLMTQWRYPEVGAGMAIRPDMQPNSPQWAPTATAAVQYGVPVGPGQGLAQGAWSHPMTNFPHMGPTAPQLWSATGQRPPGPRGQHASQPTATHTLQGAAGPVGMRPAGLSTPAGVWSGAGPQPTATPPLQGPRMPAAMRPAGLTPTHASTGNRSWRGPLGHPFPTQESLSHQPSEVLLQQLLDKANAVFPAGASASGVDSAAAAAAGTPQLSAGGVGGPAITTPRQITPQEVLQSQTPMGLLILGLQEQDCKTYLQALMQWGIEQREEDRGSLLWTRFERVLPRVPPEAIVMYGRLLLSHASGKDVLGLPGAAASVPVPNTLFAVSPANVMAAVSQMDNIHWKVRALQREALQGRTVNFTCGTEAVHMLPVEFWTAREDWHLLQLAHKFGHPAFSGYGRALWPDKSLSPMGIALARNMGILGAEETPPSSILPSDADRLQMVQWVTKRFTALTHCIAAEKAELQQQLATGDNPAAGPAPTHIRSAGMGLAASAPTSPKTIAGGSRISPLQLSAAGPACSVPTAATPLQAAAHKGSAAAPTPLQPAPAQSGPAATPTLQSVMEPCNLNDTAAGPASAAAQPHGYGDAIAQAGTASSLPSELHQGFEAISVRPAPSPQSLASAAAAALLYNAEPPTVPGHSMSAGSKPIHEPLLQSGDHARTVSFVPHVRGWSVSSAPTALQSAEAPHTEEPSALKNIAYPPICNPFSQPTPVPVSPVQVLTPKETPHPTAAAATVHPLTSTADCSPAKPTRAQIKEEGPLSAEQPDRIPTPFRTPLFRKSNANKPAAGSERAEDEMHACVLDLTADTDDSPESSAVLQSQPPTPAELPTAVQGISGLFPPNPAAIAAGMWGAAGAGADPPTTLAASAAGMHTAMQTAGTHVPPIPDAAASQLQRTQALEGVLGYLKLQPPRHQDHHQQLGLGHTSQPSVQHGGRVEPGAVVGEDEKRQQRMAQNEALEQRRRLLQERLDQACLFSSPARPEANATQQRTASPSPARTVMFDGSPEIILQDQPPAKSQLQPLINSGLSPLAAGSDGVSAKLVATEAGDKPSAASSLSPTATNAAANGSFGAGNAAGGKSEATKALSPKAVKAVGRLFRKASTGSQSGGSPAAASGSPAAAAVGSPFNTSGAAARPLYTVTSGGAVPEGGPSRDTTTSGQLASGAHVLGYLPHGSAITAGPSSVAALEPAATQTAVQSMVEGSHVEEPDVQMVGANFQLSSEPPQAASFEEQVLQVQINLKAAEQKLLRAKAMREKINSGVSSLQKLLSGGPQSLRCRLGQTPEEAHQAHLEAWHIKQTQLKAITSLCTRQLDVVQKLTWQQERLQQQGPGGYNSTHAHSQSPIAKLTDPQLGPIPTRPPSGPIHFSHPSSTATSQVGHSHDPHIHIHGIQQDPAGVHQPAAPQVGHPSGPTAHSHVAQQDAAGIHQPAAPQMGHSSGPTAHFHMAQQDAAGTLQEVGGDQTQVGGGLPPGYAAGNGGYAAPPAHLLTGVGPAQMLGPQTASQSGGSFPHERAWTPGLGNCSDGVQSRQIGSEAHVRRQQNVQRGRQLLQALPKELRQVVKTCSQLYQLKAQIASDRATANECATTLDVRHAAREYFQRQLMEMEQLAEHMTSGVRRLQCQPQLRLVHSSNNSSAAHQNSLGLQTAAGLQPTPYPSVGLLRVLHHQSQQPQQQQAELKQTLSKAQPVRLVVRGNQLVHDLQPQDGALQGGNGDGHGVTEGCSSGPAVAAPAASQMTSAQLSGGSYSQHQPRILFDPPGSTKLTEGPPMPQHLQQQQQPHGQLQIVPAQERLQYQSHGQPQQQQQNVSGHLQMRHNEGVSQHHSHGPGRSTRDTFLQRHPSWQTHEAVGEQRVQSVMSRAQAQMQGHTTPNSQPQSLTAHQQHTDGDQRGSLGGSGLQQIPSQGQLRGPSPRTGQSQAADGQTSQQQQQQAQQPSEHQQRSPTLNGLHPHATDQSPGLFYQNGQLQHSHNHHPGANVLPTSRPPQAESRTEHQQELIRNSHMAVQGDQSAKVASSTFQQSPLMTHVAAAGRYPAQLPVPEVQTLEHALSQGSQPAAGSHAQGPIDLTSDSSQPTTPSKASLQMSHQQQPRGPASPVMPTQTPTQQQQQQQQALAQALQWSADGPPLPELQQHVLASGHITALPHSPRQGPIGPLQQHDSGRPCAHRRSAASTPAAGGVLQSPSGVPDPHLSTRGTAETGATILRALSMPKEDAVSPSGERSSGVSKVAGGCHPIIQLQNPRPAVDDPVDESLPIPHRVKVDSRSIGRAEAAVTSPQKSGASAQKSGSSLGFSGEGGSPDAAGSSLQKARRWKRAIMIPSTSSEHLNQRFKDAMKWHNHTYHPSSTADTAATPDHAADLAKSMEPTATAAPIATQALLLPNPETCADRAAAFANAGPERDLHSWAFQAQPRADLRQKVTTASSPSADQEHPGPASLTVAPTVAEPAIGASVIAADTRPSDERSAKRLCLELSLAKHTPPATAECLTTELPGGAAKPGFCHGQHKAGEQVMTMAEAAAIPSQSDTSLLTAGNAHVNSLPNASSVQELVSSCPAPEAAGLQLEGDEEQLGAVEMEADTTMRVITLHGEQVEARVLEEAKSDEDIEID
ncbi:hypothetical protein WJX74_010226 [Apatococcus lobatus]|uniref:Uncharacterized protein n=1 Tax=Apatococcus lobatus TaxID=904363 RepID=A0AAW1QA49_9CHLO